MTSFSRPNILILYTDQQRWDSLKCYGNELAKTPNLDELASRGVRFNHYYVQNPVCMPSRMSFLTGRYPSSLEVGHNGIPFPPDAVPINQILKPYGYHTGQLGKLHFQPHAKRDHREPHPTYGFDTFILSDEPGCYDDAYMKWVESIAPNMVNKVRCSLPPAAHKHGQKPYVETPRQTHEPYIFEGDEDLTHSAFVTSEVCNFIRKHRKGPFFAIGGFYAPHAPVNPPKRFVDMYNINNMPLPKMGEEEKFAPFLKDVPAQKWRETIAYYLALVSHVDDCVGKIIQQLKEEGIFENTIVIFTSDHGEFLGDHGRVAKGMPGHDCITRVPFIISYPDGIGGGKVVDDLVEAVDVVPTLLDYCGIQTPGIIQGKSLKGLLEGGVNYHREDVLTEMFSPGGVTQTTVRTKDYKYYCDSKGREVLYDLKEDPDELKNVVKEDRYKDVLSDMRKRLILRIQNAAYKCRERDADY